MSAYNVPAINFVSVLIAMCILQVGASDTALARANKQCTGWTTGTGQDYGVAHADYHKRGSFEKRQLAEARAKIRSINNWSSKIKAYRKNYSWRWDDAVGKRISCEFEGERLPSDLETGAVICKASAQPCRAINPAANSKFRIRK